jgi:translation elongation factor P/translation initiation factor 5A
MKKQAKDLKKGDKIKILDKIWVVDFVEVSAIGKQGSSKCRLELSSKTEKIAVIRPAEYPFECA